MNGKPLESWGDIDNACGVMNMRILKTWCPECGAPAVIKKTEWKDTTSFKAADLYCACSDVECGFTFVHNLTYSHPLSPSAKGGDRLVHSLISQLRPEQRQYALNLLQAG